MSASAPSSFPSPVPSRPAKARGWSKRSLVFLIVGAFLTVAAGATAYLVAGNPFQQPRTDLVTHRVHYERLELNIVERGTLESAKNSDIYCTLKAGAKGSTIASTIKWLIDDGSQVKEGDLLIALDDSGLQEQLKAQKITLDAAEALKVQTEENYKIVLSQNDSDIKTAEVTLELAEIDLEKYQEGDFPQALKDVEGRIKVAESDLEQQRDRAAWANRMVKKGYLTASQSQAEQSKMESYDLALRKVLEEKRVLTDPKYGLKKRTETDLVNHVSEAKRALERTRSQANAKEVQARIDREAKKSIYLQELTRLKDVEEEIKKCKIVAPQDGMVVYFVPEQARSGGGSQQSIIAQGEPVREGQRLMQIPDLRSMQVNTKVHEALVSRVSTGQPALIRVESFPDRVLHGHVEAVATVSSQQDWYSSDVKVYTTKVLIDEEVIGLKPGMSAQVTITVGAALENVLTLPVQAIVGTADTGRRRKCVVVTEAGPEERDILVGQSNDRVAEIREGLREGDEVVLNPKAVLGNKVKTREPGAGKGDTDNGKSGGDSRDKSGDRKKRLGPPKGADPDNGGPGPQSNADDGPKQAQQALERFRQATPEQRKQMLERVPEGYRNQFKERLKEQGIEVN